MTEALISKRELLRDGVVTPTAYAQAIRHGLLNPVGERMVGRGHQLRFTMSEARAYWLVCKYGLHRTVMHGFHVLPADGGVLLKPKTRA